jgi:DNA repair photolyase
MLDIFVGGYLFHPAAVDYSGATCTNGCAYCFANINKESREGKLKGAINTLYKKTPVTYMDMLLNEGYPILLSNRSDPFTEKNKRESIAFFTHLAERKAGVFIQTKTGPGLDECLSLMGARRDVVVYITITTIHDELAAMYEPFAPRPSKRIETAKRLHDMGYMVIVAVNPLNEAWMNRNDLKIFVTDLKAYGIKHICIEMLDIKQRRLGLLSQSKKDRLGKALESVGDKNRMYVRECTEWLVSSEMSVAKKGMPFRTSFFDDIKKNLGKTMPVLQDFVNYCFKKSGGHGIVVGFDDFINVIAKDSFFHKQIGQNTIRAYLLRSGFLTWKDNQQVHSHKDLLRIIWNDGRSKLSVQRHSLFAIAGRDGKRILDENGNVKLYFDGSPHFNKKEVVET